MKEIDQRVKTVFLDRDGVINEDSPDYIKSTDEFQFLQNSVEAIRRLSVNHFDIIIITNQSAVNRKMISAETLENIFLKMTTGVEAAGGLIKDIFYCPHLPEENCHCRKPKPGLILAAQKKYQIDLSESIMVGDSAKDIVCGKNSGCRYSALVKTGNGQVAQKILTEKNIFPDYTGNDLLDVANWIIRKFRTS